MKNLGNIVLLFAMGVVLASGQTSPVVRVEPALDEIVPPDAKLEKVAGELRHLEGPVWVR